MDPALKGPTNNNSNTWQNAAKSYKSVPGNITKQVEEEKTKTKKDSKTIKSKPLVFNNLKLQAKPDPVNKPPVNQFSKFIGKVRKSMFFEFFPPAAAIMGLYTAFRVMTGEVKKTSEKIAKLFGAALLMSSSFLLEKFVFPLLDKYAEPPDRDIVDLDKDICWDKSSKAEFYRALRQFFGYSSSLQNKGDMRAVGTRRGGMMILSGPPGTGKTAIAKGTARLAGRKLISIKVSNIENMFVGESEKRMMQYFERAKRDNAILFFDEADALLRTRGGQQMGGIHASKLTNTFLQAFNEFQDENVMCILATNDPGAIDPAIKSRAYLANIAKPSIELREAIFKKKLEAHNIKPEMYKDLLVSEKGKLRELIETYEFTGRDIEAGILDALSVAEERIANLEHNNMLSPQNNKLMIRDLKEAFESILRNNEAAKVNTLVDDKNPIKDAINKFKDSFLNISPDAKKSKEKADTEQDNEYAAV